MSLEKYKGNFSNILLPCLLYFPSPTFKMCSQDQLLICSSSDSVFASVCCLLSNNHGINDTPGKINSLWLNSKASLCLFCCCLNLMTATLLFSPKLNSLSAAASREDLPAFRNCPPRVGNNQNYLDIRTAFSSNSLDVVFLNLV